MVAAGGGEGLCIEDTEWSAGRGLDRMASHPAAERAGMAESALDDDISLFKQSAVLFCGFLNDLNASCYS